LEIFYTGLLVTSFLAMASLSAYGAYRLYRGQR